MKVLGKGDEYETMIYFAVHIETAELLGLHADQRCTLW